MTFVKRRPSQRPPPSRGRPPESVTAVYQLGRPGRECTVCTSDLAEDGVEVDFKLADGGRGFYCRPCIALLGRVLKRRKLDEPETRGGDR